MSVLDGKLTLTYKGVAYTLQTQPHAAAPYDQTQAFFTALAAAGNAGTVVTTSTSTTLTPAQNGVVVEFTGGTAAQTISLPTASSAKGVEFAVTNLASVTVSVTSAGGNILANGVAAALTRVLTAYTAGANLTSLRFRSDGTQWVVTLANGGTFT